VENKSKESIHKPQQQSTTNKTLPSVQTIKISQPEKTPLKSANSISVEAENLLLTKYKKLLDKSIPWSTIILEGVIGKGAFGEVYKAKYNNKIIAVKKFLTSKDGKYSEKQLEFFFYKEMEILTQIDPHQNIVEVFGVSTDYDNLAIIMQYYPKGSAHDFLIRDKNVISWKDTVKIAKTTAMGLWHLHSQDIIHRDVALRNILIDDNMNACLTDFGLALIKEEIQKKSKSMGSLAWMAPEAISKKLISEQSDIYSFGILLWELLTKATPYEDENPFDILNGVTAGTLRPHIPTDCPTIYKKLIEDCLKQSTEERPPLSVICKTLTQYEKSL